MDKTGRNAIRILSFGFLGCLSILMVAAGAIYWIGLEGSVDAPDSEHATSQEGSENQDLEAHQDAASTGPEPNVVPTESSHSSSDAASEDAHTAADDLDVPADRVQEALHRIGYDKTGANAPWMPQYPQILAPEELWRKSSGHTPFSESMQVLLCEVSLDSDHGWDPFNGAPDPQLRISHRNTEIFYGQKSQRHRAYFSAFQADFKPSDILSLELFDFDALNQNDYVGSWSFNIEAEASYQHKGHLHDMACLFPPPSLVETEAQLLLQRLDMRKRLSMRLDMTQAHLGFPHDAYKHITREIEGVAALVGLSDDRVKALLIEDAKIAEAWLGQVLPELGAAYLNRPRVTDLSFDDWTISRFEVDCERAAFCKIHLFLTSKRAIDLAPVYQRQPLQISFFDMMGIEHDMRLSSLKHNGARIGDYDLQYRSVPIEAGAELEAQFKLEACVDCDVYAQALRQDVRLIRLQMFAQDKAELVSLRE